MPKAAMKLLLAASLFLVVPCARAANPSMSEDFTRMMQWLSHEMVQGLAFNAGSTFDPPREVKDRRLQPDVSLGLGKMPLDKSRFPALATPALREMGAQSIFPSSVLFPNLAMHGRIGLPKRFDLSLRFADMTTPSGYKIAPGTTGSGQSNSLGLGLRKHFFGLGGSPLLSVGANYNHVSGRFRYESKFNIDTIPGFSAQSDMVGTVKWSVNSYGLNAVLSQTWANWTPFFGFGYNRVTGSVETRLEAIPNTILISRISGEASEHPEESQGRVILGTQLNRSWFNLFANGEIKAIGIGAGQSWIVHAGLTLPFHVSSPVKFLAKRMKFRKVSAPARVEAGKVEMSEFVFIQ
ncbi:MAG: hypothetical protein HY921_08435 [Elusimicrobia bacterium]|nr:hypothetical protein [Elusimicrobiota bacterium]